MQDKYHLYFLFDLMNGGDLMDTLVAEAKVIRRRVPQGGWKRACFAPKVPNRAVPMLPCCRVFPGSELHRTEHACKRPVASAAVRRNAGFALPCSGRVVTAQHSLRSVLHNLIVGGAPASTLSRLCCPSWTVAGGVEAP